MERVNHLKGLVTFMSEATKELIWMNQREEPEVSRDWSRTDLDIEELQANGEVRYHTWKERVLEIIMCRYKSWSVGSRIYRPEREEERTSGSDC